MSESESAFLHKQEEGAVFKEQIALRCPDFLAPAQLKAEEKMTSDFVTEAGNTRS